MRKLAIVAAPLAFTLSGCGGEPPAERADSDAAVIPEPEGVASTYTDFALDACEVLSEEREEGSSAEYRCPGFGDDPIFVQEGDGRFDLDAGDDNELFETIGAFNDIGDTIEWRLNGNRPFAVIFRYRDVTMESGGRTVLAVETVGRDGVLGCRLAQISGDTPDANQRARDIADTAIQPGFSCPEYPEIIGNAR